MIFRTTITRSLLILALAAAPGMAHADTFAWKFASPNVSGTGTLTAVAYGSAGEFLITGGTGTVTDSTYGAVAVTFYAYTNNGYQNLTTPFTVTPFVAATPEPSTLVLVGSGLLGVYARFKRRSA